MGHCIDTVHTETDEDYRGFFFIQTKDEDQADLTVEEQFSFIGGIYEGAAVPATNSRTYFETVFVSG